MNENKNLEYYGENEEAQQPEDAYEETALEEETAVEEDPTAVSQTVRQEMPEEGPKPKPQHSKIAIAALICGGVGFIFNPMYLVTLAAIILGIMGIVNAKDGPKGMAIAGLVLGCIALPIQLVTDTILSVFTFGASFCI